MTSTVANMMNRDHMRAFFRRAAGLVAFVALLWAVHLLNWIIGYGLNPAFGLIPRYLGGLDGVIAMPLLHGSSAIHIGASGLVFGWFGFLVVRGLVDRSPITLGAALLVGVLYGSLLWGVLPGQPGVSWEAHLFGAIAGAAAALLVRTRVHAPRLGDVDLE
ncbi:rhomboid family intramembrane serine protease [Hoeflea sp.]|uniref:rhomboid family intramembrane serine protease n=1 Tax=Hoeflea sp. TaxID=1940281 RepID=UPI0025BE2F6E|nr:rhomboid family intramembrane serine protease [Hoeflea sp.]